MLECLPQADVYRLLEPGPVVLLTTMMGGRANIMTLSWHMMVDFEPPLVACVVSSLDHSFQALNATGECVIAVPPASLVAKVVAVGNCTGRDTDKFTEIGLTPLPAETVGAPLVADCLANLECQVVDRRLVDTHDLFILEVTRAWRDPAPGDHRTLHHQGRGTFVVDGERITLPSRMR